ncbi:MAG: YdcF family protein [Gammaproteobacteria bacterium]|nr:YdcF family protein [Gammaproteobacteria bacterium]
MPVIFSGGSDFLRLKVDPNGHFARTLLSAINVRNDRIIIESQSRNTYENFLLMKSILPKLKGNHLLVTSDFHMPRAVDVARKQRIDVIPYPVDYRSSKSHFRQWDFNAYEHIEVLEPAWREWIGLTAYYLTGKTSEWLPSDVK